jgi:DNA (cytosine-5)-methyltransferase 1
MTEYRVIDLFCGAGGMTLGFVSPEFGGGFKSVLAIDNDEAAIATHSANFKGAVFCGNIEDWLVQGPKIPEADVVIGGPPCQGFSLLNKNRAGDKRRALWEPYLDVVAQCGAKVFVMENVGELFRSQELDRIKRRAKKLGFEVSAGIVNAADYGTPQTRKRTLVVGWRIGIGSAPTFPPLPTHASPDQKHTNLPHWRTVRDAIAKLGKPVGTEIRKARPPLDLHFGRSPTAKSLARYKVIPEGGNRFNLQKDALHLTPQCWIKKTSGGTDLFGRLWWDRPSVTIRTEFFKPEKGRYLHPVEHRPITHREAARLMGFPDSFQFKGTKVEIARQIGNAVPPPLAGAIAIMIRHALDATANRKLLNREARVAETFAA